MAFSTSNIKATAVQTFMEGLLTDNNDWAQIFNLMNQDVASIRLAGIQASPNIPTWNGTASVTPDTPAEDLTNTLTYQAYAQQCRLSKFDIKDNPDLVSLVSNKMARSVNSTMRNLAYTKLAGAFGGTLSDGNPLCSGSGRTDSAGDTRVNKLTSALTQTSFEDAIEALRKFKTAKAQANDVVDMGALYLVVPPELEVLARQIVGSDFHGGAHTAATFNRLNVTKGRATVLVSNQLTDANDWFLVSEPPISPLVFWTRSTPEYTAVVDQDNQYLKLTTIFAAVADFRPDPTGILGCSVT
jgi:hypothetical protein